MQSFLDLLKREIHLVTNDHSLLLTLLIAPVLYAFFYGSIYSNKEEKEVKIAVVDADGSALSRKIIQKIDESDIADVRSISNLGKAKYQMHLGKVQGFLYLEKGLEKKVLSLKQGNAVLALNTSRFLPSSDLLSTITQITLATGVGVRRNYFKKKGKGTLLSVQEAQPVKLNYKPLYNVTGSYGGFLLPGLLALILQQTLLIGLAGSMSLERQKKKIADLLNLGENSYSSVLWGKGLFYFLLFSCYALFFLTINFNVLHLQMRANPFSMGILMALFLMTLIPLGLWLGSLFKSQILSVQLMAFSSYPIFLITGYSLPYDALPKTVQGISALLPTTPFLMAYQSMVQTGGTLIDNKWHVVHLVVLWLFFCGLFIWRMRGLKRKAGRINFIKKE